MVKIFLKILLVSILFFGCEEIPNEIIEIQTVDYVVKNITAPSEVIFAEDNVLQTSISVNNSEDIQDVWFNLDTLNGTFSISSNIKMETENGSFYQGEFEFDESIFPGTYEIKYYIRDNINVDGENIKKVGSKSFNYKLEKENFPPAISVYNIYENAVQGNNILISVRALDPNGLDDIKNVYFELFSPDGSLVVGADESTKFMMFDNGNSENGDAVANDGIFSSIYLLDKSAELGDWKIMIYAIDQQDSLSQPIESFVNVSANSAPVISSLNLPASVDRGVNFVFSILASDENGLSDIYAVYFELKRPDGSIVYLDEENNITKFPMFDNGDTDGSGDELAGDGIYSLMNSFGSTSQTGDWEFTFGAIDNSGVESNTIIQTLEVK